MSFRIAIVVVAILLFASYQQVKPQANNSYNGFDLADKTGDIRKPGDFRDHYQALGTYTVLDPKGDQMHLTYASPGATEYYRKNGKFADGTVLVKEVFGTGHAQMTTGDAHWASGTKVWFVMIKDERLPGLSHPRKSDGLDLRARLSGSRLKVTNTV
jgi:hypothetical protein